MVNVFSIDLEDYFHPTEVGAADLSRWPSFQPRLNLGTSKLLNLLATHNYRATFFVLGWVADHHPELLRTIVKAGHEIGCHSYAHRLVYDLTPAEFREDTHKAITAIEDACGITPRVYRAPSFSITQKSLWALEILAERGFTHDSSICPIVHDRYGIPGTPRHAHLIKTPSGTLTEVPVATVQLSGKRVAPVGGGAYLRLFPYRYTAAGIRRINTFDHEPACLYVHPWELDRDQPRLAKGAISNLRTYLGVRSVGQKLDRLFQEFTFSTLTDVHPHPAVQSRSKTPDPISNVRQLKIAI